MVDGVGLGEDDLGEGDEGVAVLEVGLKGQPCPYPGWALAPAVWGHEGRQVEDPFPPRERRIVSHTPSECAVKDWRQRIKMMPNRQGLFGEMAQIIAQQASPTGAIPPDGDACCPLYCRQNI